MPHQLYHLVAFLVSAFVVLWTTPVVNKFGHQSGLVDLPNERKVHQRPMVRLGGVSIFIGTIIALLIVWGTGGFGTLPPNKDSEIWGVTVGGLAFFLIGLADDLYTLSPFTRLFAQVIVACWAWHAGVQIAFLTVPFHELVTLPDWISCPITVLWLVGMVNAICITD